MVVVMLGCLLRLPGTAVGQWYRGGTLHEATGLEWQNADAQNHLATAADMVAALVKGGNATITYQTIDDVRIYAELLSGCITEATKTRAASTLPVQDIAALRVVSMEWQAK
jgi:hypothetical protein